MECGRKNVPAALEDAPFLSQGFGGDAMAICVDYLIPPPLMAGGKCSRDDFDGPVREKARTGRHRWSPRDGRQY